MAVTAKIRKLAIDHLKAHGIDVPSSGVQFKKRPNTLTVSWPGAVHRLTMQESNTDKRNIAGMINNKLVQLGYAKWEGSRLVVLRKYRQDVLDIAQELKANCQT